MHHRDGGFPVLLLLVPLISLPLVGCVTTSDLDKLSVRLTERIEKMESRGQEQADALMTRLRVIDKEQQTIRSEVGEATQALTAVRADTKVAVETVQKTEEVQLQRHKELQTDILRNRKSLAQYAGQSAEALKRIADFTGQVCHQVEQLNKTVLHTLLGNYRAEEAALRERLKAVEHTRKQLESVGGSTQDEEGMTPSSQEHSDKPAAMDRAAATE